MRSRKRPYALRVAARQPITRGDGHESRYHAAADIERKGRQPAFLPKRQAIARKGGKRGEATAHTDRQEALRRQRDVRMACEESCQ